MKLPVWRLIAGILVLLTMAGVLAALAPVYIENYRLSRYTHSLVRAPNAAKTSDGVVRSAILARAKQLDLPVAANDVRITHDGDRLRLQLNYAVQLDFALYQVDLHFHTSAAGR